jgi:signal transduction histidine kinase
MAYVQNNTSPVWPPTGIAVAALILLGYGVWPGISLGVLLGSLLTGADIGIAVGMSVGNTLEAIICAILLRRIVGFHPEMDRVRDVVGLSLVSMLSAAIGATFGTSTLLAFGRAALAEYWPIWSTWWIGDLLGALVVAPVLMVWISKRLLGLQFRRGIEGVLILTILALLTWYVFAGPPPEGVFHQALIYMIFPFTIWAALRLGQRGATSSTLIVSGIATWETIQGTGPFSLESINDSLVLLQTFMGVVSLTALVVAAASIERRKSAETLRQRAKDLSTLNASSMSFLDNFQIGRVYRTICRLAVTRLGLDVAWIEAIAGEEESLFLPVTQGASAHAIDTFKSIWESESDELTVTRMKRLDDLPFPGGKEDPFQAYLSIPLKFSDKSIGVLKLLSKDRDFFSEDKRLLIQSYANLAAVAIQNALLFDEVRVTNKQLRALSQRLMKAQEHERLRLSRELHDESGQMLAALVVKLGLLERESHDPSDLSANVAELKSTLSLLQENLHRLAVDLRPSSLDHLGLVTATQQYIRDFGRQYGIAVEFDALGLQEKRLTTEIEIALYRIIQEALTNVALHSRASRVDVLMDSRDSHVSVIVEDNGVGFQRAYTAEGEHLGLFGMRERVQMLGGKLTIETAPDKGTMIKVEVPYSD